MNRKQRRSAKKLAKEVENPAMERVNRLVSGMPNDCNACSTLFDKNNEKMINEWTVIVREDENTTRLYCPECWAKAKKLIEKVKEESSVPLRKNEN